MSYVGVVVVLAGLACCGDNNLYCNHPDTPEYDCTPVSLGTPNTCSGGPPNLDDPSYAQYDVDKAFPVGCHVRLPFCGFYGAAQPCDCVAGPNSGGTWACPV